MNCSAKTENGRPCSRAASHIADGSPYCYQHVRQRHSPECVASWADIDDRTLHEIRDLAPSFPAPARWRLIKPLWRYRWFDERVPVNGCVCCGRRAKTRSVITHPITLRRMYWQLCGKSRCAAKLRAWEGAADSRRRRAQYDWERQNPELAPLMLIGQIPPQYPSVSRATLRAFLDSGKDIATVEGGNVSWLNGSIRSLGFADEVYAEIRSGQTVLRRVPRQERVS